MRVKIHLLVILFFCIWNTKLVSAQGLISVKHYSIEDGLSQSKIQSILQDKEGYLAGHLERIGEIRWVYFQKL